MKLVNLTQDSLVINELTIADGFFSRLKGLMFTKSLTENQGLLISPCQQVHTHFMNYPLDIIFLDKEFKVLFVMINLVPWRFSRFIKDAKYILELSSNHPSNIRVNDILTIKEK